MEVRRNMRIAEILLDSFPSPMWYLLKQLGVDEVVGTLPGIHSDWRSESSDIPWGYAPLSDYKNRLSEHGLKLVAIEDNPPMDNIRYGTPRKEEEMENILKLIENMGRLGIDTWCYNWMAGAGWYRSKSGVRTRGGAITTAFDYDAVREYPLPKSGRIERTDLWRNLENFLKTVIPVAEEYEVRIAMHPDDPPIESIRGIPRIMNSISSYDRLMKIVPSVSNAITLCQGNFTLMTDDLPTVIRHFKDNIAFVHFRDVEGNPYNFTETFIDQGKTDMVKCIEAYVDIDYNGIVRTDHTPTLHGDSADVPGYSTLGRLHAVGYLQGLYDAVSRFKTNKQPTLGVLGNRPMEEK